MNDPLAFLLPYEFSPIVLAACLAAAAIYARGLLRRRRRGLADGWIRPLGYFLGVALMYGVLQTHYDYMSQHMFFLHRLQHLVLHHLAPFLIMLSVPGPILVAGVPGPVRRRLLRPLARSPAVRIPYRIVQQPIVAATLFFGLIYLWLFPSLHVYAMLNVPLYDTMNWSMAIDGLFFWYLMLASPGPMRGGLHYGWRMLILGAVIPPQIVVGAYIALSGKDLYTIYAVCGRLWPINAMTDQVIGGLVTWIPAAMMSAIGAIVLLHRWMHEENAALEPAQPKSAYA
ncbi:MAG TPA: cytochrome c oxidase assembly protein [Gammaproteobacteria bacterium]|nr:cytochrome c oxidase assembly protein [Gammaproteobacteria bacterium]